jgi:muramoyltetrapeptide carboxypeptidase
MVKQTSLKPPALQKGDKIGIMAPSSKVDAAVVAKAVKFLEKEGYKVYVHPQTYKVKKQSAGTKEEKLKALHDLFADPSIKAIFAARGGNRASYLLDGLDYKLIRKNPKILMGFSDVTAPLQAIYKQTGLVTFHGPVLSNFARGMDEDHLKQCFNLLAGTELSLPMEGARVFQKGSRKTAEGPLIGGNLSLISGMAGTPYMPDTEGAIIFLEDCDDEISRFERMLLQLRNAGMLDKAAALVIGQFTNVQDTGPHFFGFTLEEVIADVTKGLKIPVIMNAPFGHGKSLGTYPVGATARLDLSGKNPTLKLTGPAVK